MRIHLSKTLDVIIPSFCSQFCLLYRVSKVADDTFHHNSVTLMFTACNISFDSDSQFWRQVYLSRVTSFRCDVTTSVQTSCRNFKLTVITDLPSFLLVRCTRFKNRHVSIIIDVTVRFNRACRLSIIMIIAHRPIIWPYSILNTTSNQRSKQFDARSIAFSSVTQMG